MVEVELVGNALCLDFTNTVNARPHHTRDWLASGDEAVIWARAVGFDLAAGSATPRALVRARELREVIHALFGPIASASPPATNDLRELELAYSQAVVAGHLVAKGANYALGWGAAGDLDALLHTVVDSAMQLLAHGNLARVGECPSCGWLFVDTSKNGRRRWCSMSTCGARDKARRHYLTRTKQPGLTG